MFQISPSLSFKATLPVNPSHTMTSTSPLKMSRPSTLPMKLIGASLSALNDFLGQVVSLRVLFPMESIPTRGRRIPRMSRE